MKLIALVFLLSCSAFADLKASTRTTSAGQTVDITVLIKPDKMRSQAQVAPGLSRITIQDCSSHRLTQINDRARSFMITEISSSDDGQSSSNSRAAAGKITVTVAQQDTGERKDFFGYTARHLKGTVVAEGNSYCVANLHANTDGWYIDIPEVQSCAASFNLALRSGMGGLGCGDNATVKVSGVEKPGYPVVLDTTVDSAGNRSTIHEETTELSTATLEPSLFEVPTGYKQVNTYQALMGISTTPSQIGRAGSQPAGPISSNLPAVEANAQTAAPAAEKKGQLRIGVAQVTSIVNPALATDGWQRELVNDLNFLGGEGVILSSDPNDRDATLEEAKERNCNYVVLTTVTNYKSVSVGEKIGNVFGHGGPGGAGGSGQGRVELSAEVKIFQPDNPVPISDGNDDFRQSDPDGTARGLLHTEARDVMLQLRKLQGGK